MSILESRARLFATAAHAAVKQVRRYTCEPYINHPAAVAEIVRSVPHTEEMLAAAWLHDVIEDTGVSIELIEEEFGIEATNLVRWLTDVSIPTDGNRERRKEIDRAYISQAPAEAQTIKLADLIDNTESIEALDPDFAVVYRREKALLLEVLTRGDLALIEWARRQISVAENQATLVESHERIQP